jgi:predicted HTH domain antitoxin
MSGTGRFRPVSAIQFDIMQVTIQLPDDISAALEEQWDDVPRRSLEAIAVEAYRTTALTESQVRRLLGLDSRFQVHALLKEHHVPLQYTGADLEDDLRAQRELGILPSR